MGCIHLKMCTPNSAVDLNTPWDIKKEKQKRRKKNPGEQAASGNCKVNDNLKTHPLFL